MMFLLFLVDSFGLETVPPGSCHPASQKGPAHVSAGDVWNSP
jgi:hypothetical protein